MEPQCRLVFPDGLDARNLKSFAVSSTLKVTACVFHSKPYTVIMFGFPDVMHAVDNFVLEMLCTLDNILLTADQRQRHPGWMAFTDDGYLLVANTFPNAVHVINARTRKHVGYICGPVTTADPKLHGPHDVASRGPLVAVSCFDYEMPYVQLYERQPERKPETGDLEECPVWTPLRRIGAGSLASAFGLSFSRTGDTLAVADCTKRAVVIFCTTSGRLMCELQVPGTGSPMDVEECEEGWAVLSTRAADRGTTHVYFWDSQNRMQSEFVALLSSTCVVLQYYQHTMLYAGDARLEIGDTQAGAAMKAMSAARVAWMSALTRSFARVF